MTLTRPIVCLVTRVRGASGTSERELLLNRLAAAAEAGVSMIQVRERLLSDRDLYEFTRRLSGRVAGTTTAVVVNDRADVAIAAGADGVHLKSDGPDAASLRGIVPADFLIGRSIHTADQARGLSAAGGYDYLVFGTVFRSESKPDGHPIAGVDALAEVCRVSSIPVVAIGGIDIGRAREAAAAGASGVAAINLFASAPDIVAVTTALRDALTVPQGTV